ncbi:DEAD/DEAH box helicase [Aliikangiella sp. IMCC44359]|uniref:DEAD/DEAH box helicase n=1 Tax=Aliikangiella sp. IMCC44359 TaxID=3459125 RepID=UPI00403AF975
MSFLAQLRQQQPEVHEGLKLCYLIETIGISDFICIRLFLAELKLEQLIEIIKPYKLQISHLLHPPTFISQKDCELLQLFVANDNWQQGKNNELVGKIGDDCLKKMIDTNRCYWKCKGQAWKKISMKSRVSVQPTWQVSINGRYQLKWQAELDIGRVLLLKYNNEKIIFLHESSNSISLTKKDLTKDAYEKIKQIKSDIPIEEIENFLLQNEQQWRQLKLPLPKMLAEYSEASQINPVLLLANHHDSKHGTGGKLELFFRYVGEQYCFVVSPEECEEKHQYWNGRQVCFLKRNKVEENKCYQMLTSIVDEFLSLKDKCQWYAKEKLIWYDFFTDSVSALKNKGFDFRIESNFLFHYVVSEQWEVEICKKENNKVSLELYAEIENKKISLNSLLRQLQVFNREHAVEDATLTLSDGRLLLLPADGFNGLMSELADIFINNGKFELSPGQVSRLFNIKQQLPESTNWKGAVELLDLATSLYETPQVIEKVLSGVNAELRPYQWLGVCWLQHLKKCGVNGLLADDMGLGKTLQTLAHLSLEKTENNLIKPALIVAPTSLIHNWAAEISRFTPHLNYKVMHGEKRKHAWKKLNSYHVILTSYQLILNDLEYWKAQSLSWMILDEAQQIKNTKTLISQAIRQIKSDFRLCLSGTPVENHLGELWSLLDFLMPDCLGSLSEFKHYFQKPIEADANEERMGQLQLRISPFMLRRTKEQVASDLPPKTEIYQSISLNEEQLSFYEKQKQIEYCELEKNIQDNDNAGQRQILLLTALLKLRQVCCDPALLKRPDIKSAKRIHCISMVKELVSENRKILIFSQFTKMLDLLASDLDDIKISYLQLTGQSRNRQQIVDKFQQGQSSVFLISLKAGGVGLNLTQADTVIHFDPWWNSAAEQQATDRAHRIGQGNPVFVYKLIAENTIEEKIALLQQRKAQLSQHINRQAQLSGEQFALKLEDLMNIWQQEISK